MFRGASSHALQVGGIQGDVIDKDPPNKAVNADTSRNSKQIDPEAASEAVAAPLLVTDSDT